MTLTQQSTGANLNTAFGITATELPEATALAACTEGFKHIYTLLENWEYTDSDLKKALQLQAEVAFGGEIILRRWATKKEMSAGALAYEGGISFGGIKLNSEEKNQNERTKIFLTLAQSWHSRGVAIIATLMIDAVRCKANTDALY